MGHPRRFPRARAAGSPNLEEPQVPRGSENNLLTKTSSGAARGFLFIKTPLVVPLLFNKKPLVVPPEVSYLLRTL